MISKIDLCYGEHPRHKYDIWQPDVLSDGFPSIIHFHGGGLSSCEKQGAKGHEYITELVELGYTFFDCEYRLVPEVTPDEILVDAANAVKQAIDDIRKMGKRNGKIFVAGDSAGGWITTMLAFNKDIFRAASVDPDAIDGYIFEDPMPITHIEKALDAETAMPITKLLDNVTCPLHYVKENENYPPMFFSTYGKSIPYFAEYTHLAVATLLRYGYGDRVALFFHPNRPHGGNFEAEKENGLIPYVLHTDAFCKKVIEKG